MSGTLSETPRFEWEQGDYVVRAEPTATVDVLPYRDSATSSLSRATRNVMLPLLFGVASFGSPVVPAMRRVFSGASITRSAVAHSEWLLRTDLFYFTEERADPVEVRALNALLHLPIATGLELDLPE